MTLREQIREAREAYWDHVHVCDQCYRMQVLGRCDAGQRLMDWYRTMADALGAEQALEL